MAFLRDKNNKKNKGSYFKARGTYTNLGNNGFGKMPENVNDFDSCGVASGIANEIRKRRIWSTIWTLVLLIAIVVGIIYKGPVSRLTIVLSSIFVLFAFRIICGNFVFNMDFILDSDENKSWHQFLNAMKAFNSSQFGWISNGDPYAVLNTPIRSAKLCSKGLVAEININTKNDYFMIKGGNISTYFFPRLIIVAGRETKNVNVFSYDEVRIEAGPNMATIKTGSVPRDTQVLRWEYEHMRVNGEPDMRFKVNRRYPTCLFSELFIRLPNGGCLSFVASDPKYINLIKSDIASYRPLIGIGGVCASSEENGNTLNEVMEQDNTLESERKSLLEEVKTFIVLK
ncbi:hypothetical protein [Butyrivibrio sp. WCD2001]|uniref:hypothetical protein n=1 Tax=Butyrivibrio sp. WCD2001 TaxID=1280681 RepID=UPI000408C732|nr:hypothetical protein [Butyrivibrio sp. WCD2001]